MTTDPRPRHFPIRPDWLALRRETAVDPDQPIIDAHHHLWDKPGARYLAAEMTDDTGSGHTVVATVFVEGKTGHLPDGLPALRPTGETAMIAGLAAEADAEGATRFAAGIVAYADLRLGTAVAEVLDRHAEVARGRLRGIRDPAAWHADPSARGSVILPPPGMLHDAAFRRGLAELTRRDLSFDAWVYHTQLAELADLAHAMPDTRLVINHTGGPIGIGPYANRRAEVFDDWRQGMKTLAGFENVVVKMGGFGMLMSGFDFADRPLPPTSDALAAAWGPYFRECIALFGPDRCMFESNFPVDKGTAPYGTLWNAFKKIVADHSADERHAVFFGCANRTYRLGMTAPAEPSIARPDRGKG
ncbi:MAG: amidohydrolase family protein [Gemmobacter sp.]|nr:amidohydrolase family protein [Gemmobacter sp.]